MATGEMQLAAKFKRRHQGSTVCWLNLEDALESILNAPLPITDDGREHRDRNRGSVGNILNWQSAENEGYKSPPPAKRQPSQAAKENAAKNRTESIYVSPRVVTRLRPDAEGIAQKNRKGSVANLIDFSKNKGYHEPQAQPRLRPDGFEIATKNKGMLGVHESPALAELSIKPQQKPQNATSQIFSFIDTKQVNRKEESETLPKSTKVIKPHMKDSMFEIFEASNSPFQRDVRPPRVRPEAERIATKGKGTANLLSHKENAPVPRRPQTEHAQHKSQQHVVLNVQDESQPAPRIRPEARSFAKKNKSSTVGDILQPKVNYKRKPARY